jgi:hypothetical protein
MLFKVPRMYFEAVERFRLIFIKIEDGQEPRVRHQFSYSVGQVKEFDLAALLVHGIVTRQQITQPVRISAGDAREIQKNPVPSFIKQAADGIGQRDAASSGSELTVHVQHGYVSDLTLFDIKVCHCSFFLPPSIRITLASSGLRNGHVKC